MMILSGGAMNKLRNSIRVTAADGLSDYFVRLYKANDEFVRGRALKNESAYSIKGRLVRTINEKLVPYLSAMSIADNSAYGNFAQNVERQIKKLNSAVPKTKKSPPQ